MKQFIGLICLTLLLSACAPVSPQKLALSQDSWRAMNARQKDKLSKAYRQTEKIRQQWLAALKPEDDSAIRVKLVSGEAKFPPDYAKAAFRPVEVSLRNGQCYQNIILQKKSDLNDSIDLKACYYNDRLYLDPSINEPDKAIGSLLFPEAPIWQRGFTYPAVTSRGRIGLYQAHIEIKTAD